MWILCLSAALAGPLDAAVEQGQASVVEQLPHLERYRVGQAEVRLLKSPGPDEPARVARCAANGVDLVVDGPLDETSEVVVSGACERLTFDAPRLLADPAVVAERAPAPPSWPEVPAMGLLGAVAVLWWLAVVATVPRRLAPWGLAALALGARLLWGRAGIFMGYAYPYERMLIWSGDHPPSALYGGGWPALLHTLHPVLGAHPDGVFSANLLLSVLTVPWLWAVVRGLSGDAGSANLAAGALALLPHAVALSRTETQLVACAALLAAAMWGVVRRDGWGDLLAVASVGLLVHTRPFQVPAAAVVVVGLAASGRGWAVIGAAAIFGVRLIEVWELVSGEGVPSGAGRWVDPWLLLGRQVSRGSPTVWLDPWVTPLWIPLAGLVGFRRPGGRWFLALGLAAMLPYLHMHRVTDVLRFQLPAVTWWCALAGLAWPWLARWSVGVRMAFLALVVGTTWWARQPQGGPMAHQAEHEAMVSMMTDLHPDEVVYVATRDPHGTAARWAQVAHGVRWTPWGEGPVAVGTLVWQGRADRLSGRDPLAGCEAEAVMSWDAPVWNGGLIDLGEAPLPIRLWRITACDAL